MDDNEDVYEFDSAFQEVLDADKDEDIALDVFELLGTNHEIATGLATVEELAAKSLARKQARK